MTTEIRAEGCPKLGRPLQRGIKFELFNSRVQFRGFLKLDIAHRVSSFPKEYPIVARLICCYDTICIRLIVIGRGHWDNTLMACEAREVMATQGSIPRIYRGVNRGLMGVPV